MLEWVSPYKLREFQLCRICSKAMGVFTTGECGKLFPTRILTHEIYWGISPVKIRFSPDLFKFDVSLFCTHNLATPEK